MAGEGELMNRILSLLTELQEVNERGGPGSRREAARLIMELIMEVRLLDRSSK